MALVSSQNALFQERLSTGRVGESQIARWLRKRGNYVLPVYEIELHTGKGPRLFTPGNGEIVAPDMLCFTMGGVYWVEAKHKEAFTLYRKTGEWNTGIDLRHYLQYCEIQDRLPYEVWLLFLHRGGQAKDSPENSPAGLFGNPLEYLREHEDHRSDNWANGMVYWSIKHLRKLAELDEL